MKRIKYTFKALYQLIKCPNRYPSHYTKLDIAKLVLKGEYRIHWITG
jgi:hypothetical protein